MRADQFLDYVITPTLERMNMGDRTEKVLLLGTALVESGLDYLQQINGPALGVYQMEPATHKDIWNNYLEYRPAQIEMVSQFLGTNTLGEHELQGNLYYATAMARMHYRRVPERLPYWSDVEAMAQYHKDHFNTHLGKTDVNKSVKHFIFARDLVGSE